MKMQEEPPRPPQNTFIVSAPSFLIVPASSSTSRSSTSFTPPSTTRKNQEIQKQAFGEYCTASYPSAWRRKASLQKEYFWDCGQPTRLHEAKGQGKPLACDWIIFCESTNPTSVRGADAPPPQVTMTDEEFKSMARKVTHDIMAKETPQKGGTLKPERKKKVGIFENVPFSFFRLRPTPTNLYKKNSRLSK